MTEDQQTLSCVKLEKEDISHELMNLAIEFMCLLTGENCAVVMRTSVEDNTQTSWEPESTRVKERQSPVTVHPLPFMTLEGRTKMKILEVTQKIIKLIMDEVPTHGNFKEEGHKDVMMEDEPDGSRNRNPPQRCPHPRDSSQEDLTIPHHDQREEMITVKVKIKQEEEDETYVREGPSVVKIKVEESDLDIGTEGQHVQNGLEGQRFVSSYVKDDGRRIEEVSSDIQYRFPETYKLEKSSDLSDSENFSVNHRDDHTDCGKAEKSQHVIEESSDKSRSYSCAECGKGFTKKGNFQRHLRIHTSGNLFSCSECGKCFTQKEYLVKHQRLHTGEYPFSCSECGKCFTQKTYLVKHQRTHTSERPFVCLECGKSYTDRGNLFKHQRLHAGTSPFCCSECGKCFIHKPDLEKHYRVHTGERPFSCPVCGKAFTQKSNLLQHQKIHAR